LAFINWAPQLPLETVWEESNGTNDYFEVDGQLTVSVRRD